LIVISAIASIFKFRWQR